MKTLSAFLPIVFIGVLLSFSSCNKEEQSSSTPNEITLSLSADKTTIPVGDQAILTATVSGATGNVTYNWSVNSSSTIIGSGPQVRLYASCPSCTGPNKVTCTVKDSENNTVSKFITINVQ